MATSFGPTAIATPANAITIARLAVSPFLLLMILDGGDAWPTVALWILLAGTDGIDGYLARKHGTTRSGAFLDPLADKVLVLGGMIALVAIGSFWWLPVAIITAREAVISLYRSVVARQGITVPARSLAKIKTVVQEVAVGFALLPLTATDQSWLAVTTLWLSAGLAVVSGAQYLFDGTKVAEAQRREAPAA